MLRCVGRFSNRPVWVKRFQTVHHCSVDVARGLVLLFGIGTKALPSWDSKTRWNNLLGGLAVINPILAAFPAREYQGMNSATVNHTEFKITIGRRNRHR